MVRLGLVRVKGRSMEPELHQGDRVVVLRGVRPVIGRPHVVRLPPDGDGARRPLAIKRITGTDPDDRSRYWVDSDNPKHGVTSFDPTVGSLTQDQVRAVMLFRVPGIPRPAPYATKGIASGLQQARRLLGRR